MDKQSMRETIENMNPLCNAIIIDAYGHTYKIYLDNDEDYIFVTSVEIIDGKEVKHLISGWDIIDLINTEDIISVKMEIK